MIRKGLFIFFSFFICLGSTVIGETLWNPDFKGYLLPEDAFKVGDTIVVKISTDTTLSFQSLSQDSKSLTLQFSGGEAGNIFSFLPSLKSGGNMSGKAKEGLSLATTIAARVSKVDDNGNLEIKGSRSLSVDGKKESIYIVGVVDPRDLSEGKYIDFSLIADSSLVFKTLTSPDAPILTAADIREIVSQPAQNVAKNNNPNTATGGQGALQNVQSKGKTQFSLSDAKKRELLLSYLNKLIDLLFK